MTPQQFIAKWQAANLSERSAYQQHFLDVCDLLGQPKPADVDGDGSWYCFERGTSKTDGGNGWADVWMQGHFGWEYKGKHKDLVAAYRQLLQYRESLENPPLLIVCDLERFEVHTNFTGTAKRVHSFDLAGLAEPKHLDILRRVFTEPESLRPGLTSQSVTEQAAELFGRLADGIRIRGVPAQDAAHFLMKLMFCMFAEDIDLLPNRVFGRSLAGCKKEPRRLTAVLGSLFQAMAAGGLFGADEILYFNGGLFADSRTIDLTPDEIQTLTDLAAFDWSVVEPHVFGTLFERTLDPAKRAQIGAHYTSSDDIKTLLEPVMMAPLRAEWQAVCAKCGAMLPKLAAEAKKKGAAAKRKSALDEKDSKLRRDFNGLVRDFVERLAHVSVLDPACGSGNFLYVALRLLLDLEKQVITFAASHGLGLLPQVRPTQLHGIEINPFAQELAQVVIWIGYLQWMRDNGFNPPNHPVLEAIESIERRDAILDLSDPENPKEPAWPEAEFIVGNPPFLGGKLLRSNLGDEYVDAMFGLWNGRVSKEADLCCYWFEKARAAVAADKSRRAGLLATQGIRGGANRKVLERIKETGDIFFAESDRNWILDGATVHVSMVGFDNGTDTSRTLDANVVTQINTNLRASAADTTKARRLAANTGKSIQGDNKVGPFDIDEPLALGMLEEPNPHGRPNSDVVRPWTNGTIITSERYPGWIVDFPPETDLAQAAMYAMPFDYIKRTVYPVRSANRRAARAARWWIHGDPQKSMRSALHPLVRFICTPRVSKHRVFVWLGPEVLADSATVTVATDRDFTFGLLHSRVHELWARTQGTQLREVQSGFRYTPRSCFDTFPFPDPNEPHCNAVAAEASQLDKHRSRWLAPPEWTGEEVLEFPGSVDGPWARYIHDPDSRGIGTVRYPRLAPRDAESAKELAKRTLTNLYNERPTWLDLAHRRLDEAVFAAYGWPADLSDEDILARLLELNLSRDPTVCTEPRNRSTQ